MKNTLILGAFILTSAGVILLTAPRIYAQQVASELTLTQRLAQRFGTNVEDVQKVFDEDRAARQARMKALFAEKLATLVKEGKITEAQKTKILTKHEEIESKRTQLRESMQDKTPAERREAMQSFHDELEAWAKENGIDISSVFSMGMKNGMRHGMGMAGGWKLGTQE